MEKQKVYGNFGRTIFRVNHDKENPYVIMDKRPLANKELSWRAKGLLAYLLSLPDDWEVVLADLIKRSPDGSYIVRQCIRELVKAGHMKKEQIREGGRIVKWIWHVTEVPGLFREDQQIEIQQVEHREGTNTHSLPSNESTIINDNDKALAELSKLYLENIGAMTALTADLLRNDSLTYPAAWYKPAFEIAIKNNARNLKYIEAVLEGWRIHGFGWKPESVKKASKSDQPTTSRSSSMPSFVDGKVVTE